MAFQPGHKHSRETKNKIGNAHRGKFVSKRTRQRQSIAMKKWHEEHPNIFKGKIVSLETRKKIGAKHKGKKLSEETRKKISLAHKGKKRSKESVEKQRMKQLGISKNVKENNPRWNNGASEYPNHFILKKHRIELLKRTNGKCEICDKPAHEIHHIDESKSNHGLENLMVLCINCHRFIHAVFDNSGFRIKRTSKYKREYGMTITEISQKFNVSEYTVRYWLRTPKKQSWLKEQLGIQ